MSKTTDIVLSASAVAAALSALSHVSSQNAQFAAMGDNPGASSNKVLHITNAQTPHQDAIDAILANSSVQVELRKRMGLILPAMDVDQDSMEDAWIRLASTGDIYGGDGIGTGRLVGPNQDSVLDDRMGDSGLTTCYSNCHSACHGSRGWR